VTQSGTLFGAAEGLKVDFRVEKQNPGPKARIAKIPLLGLRRDRWI